MVKFGLSEDDPPSPAGQAGNGQPPSQPGGQHAPGLGGLGELNEVVDDVAMEVINEQVGASMLLDPPAPNVFMAAPRRTTRGTPRHSLHRFRHLGAQLPPNPQPPPSPGFNAFTTYRDPNPLLENNPFWPGPKTRPPRPAAPPRVPTPAPFVFGQHTAPPFGHAGPHSPPTTPNKARANSNQRKPQRQHPHGTQMRGSAFKTWRGPADTATPGRDTRSSPPRHTPTTSATRNPLEALFPNPPYVPPHVSPQRGPQSGNSTASAAPWPPPAHPQGHQGSGPKQHTQYYMAYPPQYEKGHGWPEVNAQYDHARPQDRFYSTTTQHFEEVGSQTTEQTGKPPPFQHEGFTNQVKRAPIFQHEGPKYPNQGNLSPIFQHEGPQHTNQGNRTATFQHEGPQHVNQGNKTPNPEHEGPPYTNQADSVPSPHSSTTNSGDAADHDQPAAGITDSQLSSSSEEYADASQGLPWAEATFSSAATGQGTQVADIERAQALRVSGNTLYTQASFKEAMRHFSEGISIMQTVETRDAAASRLLAVLLGNRGQCHGRLGDTEAAANDWLAALAVDGSYSKPHARLGAQWLDLGQLDQAAAHYQAAVDLDQASDQHPAAQGLQAVHRARQLLQAMQGAEVREDGAEASKHWEHLQAICPRWLDLQARRVQHLGMQRHYSEAMDFAEALRSRHRHSIEAGQAHVQALYQANDLQGALAAARAMGADQSTSSASLRRLMRTIERQIKRREQGNQAHRAGHYQEAVDHYTAALGLDKANWRGNAQLLNNRAASRHMLGDTEAAIADCEAALQADPKLHKAAVRLGKLLVLGGRIDEGLQRLQGCVAADPTDQGAQEALQWAQEEVRGKQADAQAQHEADLLAWTHYEVLGISATASADEIKRAYRDMARKWHPDKHGNASAEDRGACEARFRRIQEAYRVLGSAVDRQQYDADQRRQRQHGHAPTTTASSGRGNWWGTDGGWW